MSGVRGGICCSTYEAPGSRERSTPKLRECFFSSPAADSDMKANDASGVTTRNPWQCEDIAEVDVVVVWYRYVGTARLRLRTKLFFIDFFMCVSEENKCKTSVAAMMTCRNEKHQDERPGV